MKKTSHWMRLLLVGELIILLTVFCSCFRQENTVYRFFGEDIAAVQESGEFESDRFRLSPGVYEVRMQAKLQQESIFVQVKSDGGYYKSLRNNGINCSIGQDRASFLVYVTDVVPEAYVYCNYWGESPEGLLQLEVVRTTAGQRILLTVLLAVFFCLDFLILFRKRILTGKVSRKQQLAFWGILAAVGIACLPCFTDYLITGDDIYFHLSRIAFLKDALQQGESFPVKMQGGWVYGHGYATSLFYGDLFLYLPALLNLAGFSTVTAYKIFLCLVTLATGGIAYASFKRCVKSETAAMFGSMLYLLMPYRLNNVYMRAAVGEYTAMAFLPLVCCGMYLLYTEDVTKKEYAGYKWWLAGGMSGILQCHLLTTEMTAILLAVVCALYWKKTFQKETFCQLLQAVGLVLLLNAWFWVPMLYMLGADSYELTNVMGISSQSSGIDRAGYLRWVPAVGKTYQERQIHPGVAVFLLLILEGSRIIKKKIWKRQEKEAKTEILLAAFSLCMLIFASRNFPWDFFLKLPVFKQLLGAIQFPYRWISPCCVFAAMLGAIFWKQTEQERNQVFKSAACLIPAAALLTGIYYGSSLTGEQSFVYLYNIENIGSIAVVNGEYLLQGTTADNMYYHAPAAWEGLNYSEYEKEGAKIRIRVENITDEEQILVLPLFGYRGYGVKILEGEVSGKQIPYISEARSEHGDLEVVIPAGYEGKLLIYYRGFPVFTVAEIVSLVTILLIAGKFLIPEILRCFRGEKIREV